MAKDNLTKTIAFIPVRGGSKSIPKKNIKHILGKPLVYWTIECLESCELIDKIIIATDSYEIIKCINNKTWSKVEIYIRSDENAKDTSSTESVILEYLNFAKLSTDTKFILCQATSPYTRTEDIRDALNQLEQECSDSLLSCSNQKKFLWSKEGVPINYNPQNRPRRQEFDGLIIENGAFYISRVGSILSSKCRISGKISIFLQPEYFLTEIDEEDDWIMAENILKKYIKK